MSTPSEPNAIVVLAYSVVPRRSWKRRLIFLLVLLVSAAVVCKSNLWQKRRRLMLIFSDYRLEQKCLR